MIPNEQTRKWFKSMLGRTGDDTYQPIVSDSTTHVLTTITYPHHEAHAGRFYRTGMNYTLANGNVATFGLITPNSSRWIHTVWELTATADGTFEIIEDVTSFSGGAATTPLNHNRNSSNTSITTCTKGMTGVDPITPTGGTTIVSKTLSTGKGVITDRGSGEEFILKQNSKYLFRYTNGTSANVIKLTFEWYEHGNREA